jgi:hypothetical protein
MRKKTKNTENKKNKHLNPQRIAKNLKEKKRRTKLAKDKEDDKKIIS